MSEESLLLRRKFSELLAWERIKRREQILLGAFSGSLFLSLLLLPVRALLPSWMSPFYFPPVCFAVLAPAYFFLRPWREEESLRAIVALDRNLRLQERALTASEILSRNEPGAAEQYVLHEAGRKLKDIDVRALFKRRWSWQSLPAPPLLLLWLMLVWLGVGADFGAGGSKPLSLAERLKQFSRELERKAERERLAESLKIARALQAAAEERLSGKSGDKKLGESLAAVQKQLEQKAATAGEGEVKFGDYTREEITALKAELEAMKGQLRPGSALSEKELLERLAPLARLTQAMGQGRWPAGKPGAGDLQGVLDGLEQDVTGELDRRSLADVQDFLSFLLRGGDGRELATEKLVGSGRTAQNRPDEPQKAGGQGELAGEQPGTRARLSQPPPGAGAATQLRGILGEGKGSGLTWRGEAKAGASKIPEQEAAAAYRRQVEEDLASEKIPPALKETVKKYFLSLGMEEKK